MLKHKLVRSTFLFALCLSVFGLGSCKKTVNQVVNQNFSAIYSIRPSDWTANSGSTYLAYEFAVPELDQFLLDHGGVAVYISLDGGATYEATPEVVQGVSYGSYHYLKTVGIDLAAPNGTDVIARPSVTILAKVVLLDAQPLD